MSYIEEIMKYLPKNIQEYEDKKKIQSYIEKFPQNILLRENEMAHITSSGFIMNEDLDKVLMIHHNIYNAWVWTGGHADGDSDLLHVALKEAKEETGIENVRPLLNDIASIDILPVYGHMKNGKYVCSHLHLSIAYILISSEKENLKIKEDENRGVKWISTEDINKKNFDSHDIYLYKKLINIAREK